jgi:hypothetical protein
VSIRWIVASALVAGGIGAGVLAQSTPNTPTSSPGTKSETKAGEVELVEAVLKARRDYWASLDKLRQNYVAANELEKIRWVEDELRSYHRMMKYSYRLDVKDVPPPTLQPKSNIPEANALFRRALEFKNRGTGDEYLDNQRRAEILYQAILERFPESDKIADAAYHLGDIYENYRPRPQFERSAAYYERSFQWNKAANTDARIRAARIYDRQLKMNDKAKELYKAVLNHDTNPGRVDEAERRLAELSSRR